MHPFRVPIQPRLLNWAIERSYKPVTLLEKRFPRLPKWIEGSEHPTFRQLEAFAKRTSTPVGYFFLPEPPEERLPIPDFRTVSDCPVERPSADLLDTLYLMQRRQFWLRETLIEFGAEPLPFVGSATLKHDPNEVAREMRTALGLTGEWAASMGTWRDTVSELRHRLDDLGVMAVINGVVENNTSRPLRVGEFRGFALCDPYSPLIFVNGADAKSAQIFTLAHELAHVWLGEGGVSGYERLTPGGSGVETFCNKTAAEFLAPAIELRTVWARSPGDFDLIARHFKVSPVVAARRALDLGLVSRPEFFSFHDDYMARERRQTKDRAGGDFYRNQNTRVGERFAREVICAAREGRLLFRDAYELTGLYGKTFDKYAKHLGFDVL